MSRTAHWDCRYNAKLTNVHFHLLNTFLFCETRIKCQTFFQHTEVKEEGMDVEEGEMGDEEAPAPW